MADKKTPEEIRKDILAKAKSRSAASKKKKEESEKASSPIATFSPMGFGMGVPTTQEEASARADVDRITANALMMGLPARVAGKPALDEIEAARSRSGAAGLVAEGVGLIPSSLLTMGKTLPETIIKGVVYGGATGGTLAPQGEELSGAGTGALLGGGIPAAIAGTGKVIGATYDAGKGLLGRMFAPASEKAEKRILGSLYDEGRGPQDLTTGINEPSPVTLAEQSAGEYGSGLIPLARAATANVGQAQKEAAEQLGKRASEAPERIEAAMDTLPTGRVSEEASKLASQRLKNSAPLYKEAFEYFPDPDDIDAVKGLFIGRTARPTLKKAFNTALDALRDKGREIPEFKTIVDSSGNKVEVKTDITNTPFFMETLDSTKKVLDDQISSAIKKGKWEKVRTLSQLKDELLDNIDNVNPAYLRARTTYAGDLAVENALEMGKNIFSGKVTSDVIESFIGKATSSEKEAFRLGMSELIKDNIADGVTPAVKNMLKKDFQNRLRSAFPDESSFNRFVSTVTQEINMAQKGARMTPSMPSIPGQEGGFLDTVIGAVTTPSVSGRAASGNKLSAVLVGAGKVLNNILGRSGKISQEEALEISQMLLSSTPEARKKTIDRLIERESIDQATASTINKTLEKFTGIQAERPVKRILEGQAQPTSYFGSAIFNGDN